MTKLNFFLTGANIDLPDGNGGSYYPTKIYSLFEPEQHKNIEFLLFSPEEIAGRLRLIMMTPDYKEGIQWGNGSPYGGFSGIIAPKIFGFADETIISIADNLSKLASEKPEVINMEAMNFIRKYDSLRKGIIKIYDGNSNEYEYRRSSLRNNAIDLVVDTLKIALYEADIYFPANKTIHIPAGDFKEKEFIPVAKAGFDVWANHHYPRWLETLER